MALVVFLRGVNVGGHRAFRPSLLAKELSRYDVVNVGAAGTFVVRKPGARAQFEAALRRRLPFECEVVTCEGRELVRLVKDDPFPPPRPELTRFVSVLAKSGRAPALPLDLPAQGEWLVRVLAVKGRFVCGVYRRHMKTIGCLGQLDKMFGGKATTRNWNTILSVVHAVQADAGRML